MALPLNSKSFYSKRESKLAEDIRMKLERSEEILRKNPLPPELPSSLFGPSSKWLVYSKQDEALHVAKELDLMTFSFEERVPGSEGRRKFLVTHPDNLWRRHISRPATERCTYEVIPNGCPSKLYFDLEYNKSVNSNSNGETMVQTLISAILWAFQEIYKFKLTIKDVLILEASTDKKFSQHLIFQMGNYAFLDNIQAGNFVKFIVSQLKESMIPGLSHEAQQALFVKNDKGDIVSFCDLGVYTKNRNFRLYLSSKFGKNAPFIEAKSNSFKPETGSEEDFFRASLITFFEKKELHLLCYASSNPESKNSSSSSKSTSAPRLNGYQYSPWAEIDHFIEKLVAPGTIRQWVYYEKTETIVYDINGNRYCSNIGREHKRNHIKYVVSIPNGTYYQSCFDHDCSVYRPTPIPIPDEFLPWKGIFDDDPAE